MLTLAEGRNTHDRGGHRLNAGQNGGFSALQPRKAGLQVNDIITKAGDREITSSGDLVDVVSEASSGDVLKLTVYRSGSTIEIDVTVGENIQSALANEQQTEQNKQSQQGGRYYSYGYGIPGFGGFGG